MPDDREAQGRNDVATGAKRLGRPARRPLYVAHGRPRRRHRFGAGLSGVRAVQRPEVGAGMTITIGSVLPCLGRLLQDAIEDEKGDDARALAVSMAFVMLAGRGSSPLSFNLDHLEKL